LSSCLECIQFYREKLNTIFFHFRIKQNKISIIFFLPFFSAKLILHCLEAAGRGLQKKRGWGRGEGVRPAGERDAHRMEQRAKQLSYGENTTAAGPLETQRPPADSFSNRIVFQPFSTWSHIFFGSMNKILYIFC